MPLTPELVSDMTALIDKYYPNSIAKKTEHIGQGFADNLNDQRKAQDILNSADEKNKTDYATELRQLEFLIEHKL
jgi:hypothetical protein